MLDSEAGILSYPLTNNTLYDHNVTCVWIIKNTNSPAKVLNITFTKFKLEASTNCVFDGLEIYDGPSKDYPRIGRFCGDELPKKKGNIITSFNSVYLLFRSDLYVSFEGFELNWLTTDPGITFFCFQI